MSKSKAIRLVLIAAAIVVGILGLWWLLSAYATAHLRFGYCGPTSLAHPEAYCQVGVRLLYRSYAMLAVAVALFVVGIRIGRNQRHAA